MTLIELRAKYPTLFYRNQDWFRDESFMRALPNETHRTAPRAIRKRGLVPKDGRGLPLAVDVARAYVLTPNDPKWESWLWCRDVDSHGHRVFVGVGHSSGRFEIHRHLQISDRFGVPTW